MKVTEAEKKRVWREVMPKQEKVVEWGNGIKETWGATEVYKDCHTLSVKCTYHSNWGRDFTLEGPTNDR